MDEEVEVVEEEAVVDDLHLHYDNFFGEVYEEEFVTAEGREEEADAPPIQADTVLIKIKPELLDESKKLFRVPAADVSDDLYEAFCEKVTNFDLVVSSKLEQQLDCIYHSGDWAMARNVPDAYLGVLNPVMVHLPTSKLLLKSSERSRLLSECISKHQNARNPVASALQELQKLYTGLPPVGQLRNILLEELRKVFPLAPSASVIVQPTNRKAEKRGKGWTRNVGKKKEKKTMCLEEETREEIITEPKNSSTPLIEPIHDDLYEELAEVIASGNKQLYLSLPPLFQALLAKGSLIAEHVNHGNVDLEEVVRPGWCIRERSTGRIVPRKRDVHRIYTRIRNRMSPTNSPAQIVAYIDAKFVGVTTAEQRRAARLEDVYKGSRVVFPPRPAVIGRRPMQYVQIDILDPPYDEYHSEDSEFALLIVDLHSHFAFCKPHVDISASAHELLRFTYDSFASFGPPESYLTATEKNVFLLHTMMEDIDRHFKVNIRCTGFARESTCAKMISSEAMRKVRADTTGMRWIDALHITAMEWNQRPNRAFNSAFSPFEVMFGRRVWAGEARVPPWIGKEEGREGGEEKQEKTGGDGSSEMTPLKERIQNTVTGLMPTEARMNTRTGKVSDPGTGIRYEVGDRVYVRNVHFVEGSAEMGGTMSKRRTKGQMNRYLRGVIAEHDSAHPEFFYRIIYDSSAVEQDSMPCDMWPSLDDDGTEEFDSSWFCPWDVAPSTYDIQSRRTINPSPNEIILRCECDLSYCDLTATTGCERTRSALCCARHPEGACSVHRIGRKEGGRKRKGGVEETESSQNRGEKREDDPDARYIYKDGTLVRITPIVHRPMELPDQILQD